MTELINNYFEENYNNLLNIAKCLHVKDYEDLLHNTYIECKKYEHTIRDKTKVKSWINTIMKQQAKKLYGSGDLEFDENIHKGDTDDMTHIEQNEIMEGLEFNEQLILMYLIEGFNQKEIAEMMNIKYNTLRKRVERLRDKVHKSDLL